MPIKALAALLTSTSSLPPRLLTTSWSVVSLPAMRVSARSPVTSTVLLSASTSISSALFVPLTVTASLTVADALRREVDVGESEIGAGQVVHRDRVCTTKCGEIELLNVDHVHPDDPRVAQEDRIAPVG